MAEEPFDEPFYTAEDILNKYTVEELDKRHDFIGLGPEWLLSDRRKELKDVEEAEVSLLEETIPKDTVFERFRFNEQPYIWAEHITEWQESWIKANPSFPIRTPIGRNSNDSNS